MGLGDYIYTLTDTVKSYTPNLTSVYQHHSINSTVSKFDNAVRAKLTGYLLPGVESCGKIGQKVTQYLPDEAKIGHFATNFGKNAVVLGVQEGAKLVPGGYLITKAIEKSLPVPDQKTDLVKTVNTLQARISVLEKQVAGFGKSHTGAKYSHLNITSNCQTATCLDSMMNYQKPEDVISIFMMKGFIGNKINQQISENLMVPGVGKYRK